jgi:hypothetical protein
VKLSKATKKRLGRQGKKAKLKKESESVNESLKIDLVNYIARNNPSKLDLEEQIILAEGQILKTKLQCQKNCVTRFQKDKANADIKKMQTHMSICQDQLDKFAVRGC